MRKIRVRFTKPTPPRVEKTVRIGVKQCLWSPAGRAEMKARLMRQWKDQGGICPNCNTKMTLLDSKFESKEFIEGKENSVVHKWSCVGEKTRS